MSHREEQEEEVEALQAIYVEDFEVLEGPASKYRLKLQPNDGDKENHGDFSKIPYSIIMIIYVRMAYIT